jgi:hypothetical protein
MVDPGAGRLPGLWSNAGKTRTSRAKLTELL